MCVWSLSTKAKKHEDFFFLGKERKPRPLLSGSDDEGGRLGRIVVGFGVPYR